jgi:hypothetical protein
LSGAWKTIIRVENDCRELGKGSSEQKTFVGSLEMDHPSRKRLSTQLVIPTQEESHEFDEIPPASE